MKAGAVCVVCSKKIDPAVDRPVKDRGEWFCSDICWTKYVHKIFQQQPK